MVGSREHNTQAHINSSTNTPKLMQKPRFQHTAYARGMSRICVEHKKGLKNIKELLGNKNLKRYYHYQKST